MVKRFISALTGFTLAFSMLGIVPAAAEPGVSSAVVNAENIKNNELSLEGNNTLGDMLVEKINCAEENDDMGFTIQNVAVDGKNVTVEYSFVQNCTMIVGIYDDDGAVMLGKGMTEIISGSSSKTVEIDIDTMPEYFLVKVFMVDTTSYRPLGEAYTYEFYTKKYQDFMALTTDDFNSDRVLNLDDDKKTNFIVLEDDVIRLDETDGEIADSEDDSGEVTYTISSASERVKALKKGDIFTAGEIEDIVIAKVGSITVDGDKVVITEGDVDDSDNVLRIIKIDVDSSDATVTYDDSECDEAFTFMGTDFEMPEVPDEYNGTGKLYDFNDVPEIETQKLNDALVAEAGGNIALKVDLANSELPKETEPKKGWDAHCDANGYISFSVGLELKLFEDDEGDINYIRLSAPIDLQLALTVDFEGKYSYPVGKTTLNVFFGAISADFSLEFYLSGKATVTVKGYTEYAPTYECYFRSSGWTDQTRTPECGLELSTELDASIGMTVIPKVKVISDKIASLSVELSAGLHFVTTQSVTASLNSKHQCDNCISGKLYLEASGTLTADLIGFKPYIEVLAKIDHYLWSFYWSITFADHGRGSCKHYEHKLKVHFIDEDGKCLSNATINVKNLNTGVIAPSGQKLDKKGTTDLWLANGNYEITLKMNNAYFLPYHYDNQKTEDAPRIVVMRYDRSKMPIDPVTPPKDDDPPKDDQPTDPKEDDSSSRPNDDSSSKVEITPKVEEIPQSKETFDYKKGDNIRLIEGDGQYVPSSALGFIDDNDTLFLWGYGEALSLGENDPDRNNYKAYKYYSITNVKKACVGQEYIGYLTNEGELYLIGGSKSTNKYYYNIDEEYAMFKVTDHVKDFSIGSTNMAYIKDNGDLFTTGEGQYTNYKNSFLASNVEKVECGSYGDVAFITKNKDLFMWGTNAFHNISDDDDKNYTIPEKVASNVKNVSTGCFNTYYVTETGELHSRGTNLNGETGREVGSGYSDKIIMTNVDKAYITIGKSLILDNNGDLYSCGINPLNPSENNYTPYKITENVKSMYINSSGNYMYLSNDGTIYLFGWNSGGIYNRKNHKEMGSKYDTIYDLDTLYASLGTIETYTQNTNADVSDTDPFADLLPDCIYNVYGFNQDYMDLTNEGLAYINQFVTDSNGNLPFDKTSFDGSESLFWKAVPMTRLSIANAQVEVADLEYNGEEQEIEPIVTLDGKTLVRNKDYFVAEGESATSAGKYTGIIYGIGMYKGEIEFTYNVTGGKLGDVNGDSKINITDITLVAAHVKGKRILSAEKQKAADVNKDGKINITDITKIAAHVKGKKLLTA